MLIDNNYQVTLKEYQSSDGININQQLHILFNTNLPGSMLKVLDFKNRARFDPLIKLPRTEGRLFVGSHYDGVVLKNLVKNIYKLIENTSNRYTLVLGKDIKDSPFDSGMTEAMPHNVDMVWANNVVAAHPKVKYLPLGRDWRQRKYFSMPPSGEKKILVYSNYSLDTHRSRVDYERTIKEHPALHKKHMGGRFLKYKISRELFFKKVAKSKFVLCPRGRGIDTFRLWDSLYLGAIPIVVKEAIFHEQLNDLPILFINNIGDLNDMPRKKLNDIYDEMLHKEYNYNKLYCKYWLT